MKKSLLQAWGLCLVGLASFQVRANLEDGSWIFHHQEQDHRFPVADHTRGHPVVCLEDLTRRLGLAIEYDPLAFRFTLKNRVKGHEAHFWTHSTRVEGRIDANTKNPRTFESTLSQRMDFVGARPCVPLDFGDRVLRPILTGEVPPLIPVAPSGVEVVIDAGHGGNDYGATVKDGKDVFREKDLVLVFAYDLKAALEKYGVRASLTRDQDLYLSLGERAKMGNASQAKLFLSLHMNSDPAKKKQGFEIYVLSLESSDSSGRAAVAREHQMIPEKLGSSMEKAMADLRAQVNLEASLRFASQAQTALKASFKAAGRQGVRMGPFYVLYGAMMPALLVELGYLTHPSDRQLMRNASKRQALAQALALKLAPRLLAR